MDPTGLEKDEELVSPWYTTDRRTSFDRRCFMPIIVESEEKKKPQNQRTGSSASGGGKCEKKETATNGKVSNDASLLKLKRTANENNDDKREHSMEDRETASHTHTESTHESGNEGVKEHIEHESCIPRHVNATNMKAVTEESDSVTHQKREMPNDKAEDEDAMGADPLITLLKIKCTHPNITLAPAKEEKLRKAIKRKTGRDRDADSCVICDITEAAAVSAPAESNDALLDMVYSHDFYDRYSRSGRRTCEPRLNKEVFSICKPARVSTKSLRRTNSPTEIPPQPSSSFVGAEIRVDTHLSGKASKISEKILHKPVHVKCKPKNAVYLTDALKEDQRLFIKGLRGWLLRKDEANKFSPRESKHSDYHVNSLGMHFSIPEYNTLLPIRQPLPFRRSQSSLDSPVTVLQSSSVVSPTNPDRHGYRPYTHGASPRQSSIQPNVQSAQHVHWRRDAVPGIRSHISGDPSYIASSSLKAISKGISHFKPTRANTISVESMKALMGQIANPDKAVGRSTPTNRAAQTLVLSPQRSSVK